MDKEKNLERKNKDSKQFIENVEDNLLGEELFKDLPEEERKKIGAIIRHTIISGRIFGRHPLVDKITSEHITQLIINSDEQDKRDREERKQERYYNLTLVVISLVFIAFLIVYLHTNEDLLIKIIIGIVSFIGGYGLGKSRKKKE